MLRALINVTCSLFIVSTLLCIPQKASSSETTAADQDKLPASSSSSVMVVADQFNFLTRKYPQLVARAKEPFTQSYEETKHYRKLEQLTQDKQKSKEEVLLEGAKEVLAKKTLHFFGNQHEKFVFDQILPMIQLFEANHPKHGYFNVFFSRFLTNHFLLENMLLTAEYIFQYVKDCGGGTVIYLGRTPCVVQVAYEELIQFEKDETQKYVHLNFSGHPDTLTKRESDFFKTEINIIRDMVSPDKLKHYFEYLDSKNEIINAKALYIVDIIGSGGSLNSFISVLNAYYQYRQIPIPKLTFLNLTADWNYSIDRSENFTFEKSGSVSNIGTLKLPEDKAKNLKFVSVSTCGIPIFDKALTEMLDQDMFQEFLVHGIQYPAQKWTIEFDSQRDKGGEYHKKFYEWLRLNYKRYIDYHQKHKISSQD